MPSSLSLALSSGGARGAYQSGALLFLSEAGLEFSTVAGVSVGAINGAMYSQGNGSPEAVKQIIAVWHSLARKDMVKVNPGSFSKIASCLFSGISDIPMALAALKDIHLLDPRPFEDVINEYIDFKRLLKSPIKFYVGIMMAFHPLFDVVLPHLKDVSFISNHDTDEDTFRKVILASAAMPFFFPARNIGGRKWSDPGLTCPLPDKILFDQGYRRILSLFLSDDILENPLDFPATVLFQIRPSQVIDSGLSSTFDFSEMTITKLIELGYQDAKKTWLESRAWFEKILELKARGQRNQELVNKLPVRKHGRK